MDLVMLMTGVLVGDNYGAYTGCNQAKVIHEDNTILSVLAHSLIPCILIPQSLHTTLLHCLQPRKTLSFDI